MDFAPSTDDVLNAATSVLGAIMLDNRVVERVAPLLDPATFWHPPHRLVFAEMLELANDGAPIDPVTLADALRSRGVLEQVGGMEALIDLDQHAVTAVNIEHHALMVREAADLRDLDGLAEDLHRDTGSGAGIDAVLDAHEAKIRDLKARRPKPSAWQATADLMPAALDTIQGRADGTSTEAPALRTRFVDAERFLGGLGLSDMMVLAGRPSMGKTAAALQLACEYARKAKEQDAGVVLVFSLETTTKKLVDRLLAAEARVDLNRIKAGTLLDSEWYKLRGAAQRLAAWPIFIDARKGRTVEDIAAAVSAWDGPVAAVVVDYLQIVKSRQTFHSRERTVGHIAQTLKDLADRGGDAQPHLNTRVIALAQLNRPDKRLRGKKVPRPTIADLRESGHIEQCADVIVLIHRPGYYEPDSKDVDQRAAEWIFGKNRDGATGVAHLRYFGERVRFENRAQMDVMETYG